MPCRPGLEANIQPPKMRLCSLVNVTSSTSTKAVVLGASVCGRLKQTAGRQLQRTELHGLVDGHLERDDAAGDLVEPGKHGRRVLDLVGGGRPDDGRDTDAEGENRRSPS